MRPARPYQTGDVKKILAAWKQGHRCVLHALPTGGGKTFEGSILTRLEYRARRRVLFVAHREEILIQTIRALTDAGVPESVIGLIRSDGRLNGESWINADAMVQVASIQTLARREYPNADLVVVDEAHHSAADSYRALFEHYNKTRFLGLTATPYRKDGKPLGDLFDVITEGPKPSELIKGGYLVRPRMFSKQGRIPDMSGVSIVGGDYNPKMLEERVNRRELIGDIVSHYIKHAWGKSAVVFAASLDHAKKITRRFRDCEVETEYLDGNTSPEDREAMIGKDGRLARGETTVVVNVGVLLEGWDCPPVKCIILAHPTRSMVLYLQQCGRSLRPYRNLRPIILDHAGLAMTHGLPHWDREFSLTEQLKPGKPGQAPCKVCGTCGSICAAGVSACEECGALFDMSREPEQVDGELEEIVDLTPAEKAKERKRIEALATKWGAPKGWAEKIAEVRGVAP